MDEMLRASPNTDVGKNFLRRYANEKVMNFKKSDEFLDLMKDTKLDYYKSQAFQAQVIKALTPCKMGGFTLVIETTLTNLPASCLGISKENLAGENLTILDRKAGDNINEKLNEPFGLNTLTPMVSEDEVKILEDPASVGPQASQEAPIAGGAQADLEAQVEQEVSVGQGAQVGAEAQTGQGAQVSASVMLLLARFQLRLPKILQPRLSFI